MKFFYHFLIIIFVIISLFIIKDDVIAVYHKAETYVKDNIHVITDLPKKIFTKKVTTNVDTSTINYKVDDSKNSDVDPTKTTFPGPLRVLNKFVTSDSESITLSLNKVIEETNQNRKVNGNLSPLTMNSQLNLSAEEKLEDMFKNQYFEHISPTGVGVADLVKKESYEYILIGENLALGNFKDEKSLLNAWMASPGHRANILNSHYTEIGVAVGKGKFEGKDVWMAVQHFGLPKNVCPSTDEVLHGLIVIGQQNIKDTESDLLTRKANIDKGVIYEGETKNEQVTEYNSIVNKYDAMISDIKNKIDKYNEQVKSFNLCVENSLK